ncbi:sensor histidine kinase [Puteibacter caeruleilacunae]|nr:sensor histidine kinase [Puteibacter caeruleilacunae]
MNKSLFQKYRFLLIAIVCLVAGFIMESRTFSNLTFRSNIKSFNTVFFEKEVELQQRMDDIAEKLKAGKSDNYFELLEAHNDILGKRGLGILVYNRDTLKYWSDNEISFLRHRRGMLRRKGLVQLPNGFYWKQYMVQDDYRIVGYVQLKQQFSYQNKYLKNRFRHEYHLPNNFNLLRAPQTGAFDIENKNGDYMFSLEPPDGEPSVVHYVYFPAFLFIIALLLIVLGVKKLVCDRKGKTFFLDMFVVFVIYAIIYLIITLLRIPDCFYRHELFGPQMFAYSPLLPSLGNYLILSILIVEWIHLLFVRANQTEFSERTRLSLRRIMMIVNPLYLIAACWVIQILFENSSVSFEFYKIIDLTVYSFMGILSVLFLLAGFFFLAMIYANVLAKQIHKRSFLIEVGIGGAIVVGLCLALKLEYSLGWTGLYLLLHWLIRNTKKDWFKHYRLSYLVILTLIFSIPSLVFMQENLEKREREIQKLLATNLASERDPAADLFLQEIDVKLKQDTVISELLESKQNLVDGYLLNNYFDGYWRKYELQLTICTGEDSVEVQPDNEMHPCYPFFEELIRGKGLQIPLTNFYFMDQLNGRISYLGRYSFVSEMNPEGVSLFIQLSSRTMPEGIGFPELLLDDKVHHAAIADKYSYAKYYDGSLVDRKGKYVYSYSNKFLEEKLKEGSHFVHNGYEHYVYQFGEGNQIIVSKIHLRISEYLIAFPYIFVIYFIFVVMLSYLNKNAWRQRYKQADLKARIQTAIISIVFISLLVVGGGSIYYNLEAFKIRHENELSERIQSVLRELETQLSIEDELGVEYRTFLNFELSRLSEVFWTDINLYDMNGTLLATSRPEIFQKGLTTRKMNARAFQELAYNRKMKFIHPEQIGDLSYLSAYVPLVNDQDKYLGYINLPYFIRQDTLKQEVSTFIVAYFNIYVFLILASILVAVFIANQITRPLGLLRDKLKSIQLDKKNEPIPYVGDDEIGSLVREYNKKVEELAESASLLAKSERESAWREMAKQVAHEIKNPLTPMKLNIQLLQRAKEDNHPNYDRNFDRVTKLLIEQIDNLSAIATAFSNFAKIPKSNLADVKLIGLLKDTVALFAGSRNFSIELHAKGLDHLEIVADQEQLSRVFINIVKNAIQSIPFEEEGHLDVTVIQKGDIVRLSFSDNGAGIPPEVKDKLFVPNFTTKSSGMGLGLAISKNIIESLNGTIGCRNKDEGGAEFIIELPITQQSKK